jgi:hypothetical protein
MGCRRWADRRVSKETSLFAGLTKAFLHGDAATVETSTTVVEDLPNLLALLK